MTPDDAAQAKHLPDSAELPMDMGQRRSSADPAYGEAATPSTADLEPELLDQPPIEATAGADESADSEATVSGSQDFAEEDEVLQFTAWVRERLQQQEQEADAPREDGVEGQAALAQSRREEDGPQMVTGYSGGLGSNQLCCGCFWGLAEGPQLVQVATAARQPQVHETGPAV